MTKGNLALWEYLDRLGFFSYLDSSVNVIPAPPLFSGAQIRRGSNPGLVEIEAISPAHRDNSLPGRLADRLKQAVTDANSQKALSRAAFTVFGELIDNVFQHSSTDLDGFAALQVYTTGGRAKVIVSDSGKGLLETLRPALVRESSAHAALSDADLLLTVFRSGLSRFGATRGMGLKTSAETAIKYKADLYVRLPRCRIHFTPTRQGYGKGYVQDGLPLTWGTHICFDFHIG